MKSIKDIEPLLDEHPFISSWSVDLDDVDKVLRIVASRELQEEEIINLLTSREYDAEVLSW